MSLRSFTASPPPGIRGLTGATRLDLKLDGDTVRIEEHTMDTLGLLLKKHAVTIVHTRDRAIREALIRLGWTPPPAPRNAAPSDAPADYEMLRRVRAHDPASSVIAAERAARFAGGHKERILDAMGDDELSSHQIARLSGLTVVQVDRRLPELVRDHRLEVVTQDGVELLVCGYRVYRRIRSS